MNLAMQTAPYIVAAVTAAITIAFPTPEDLKPLSTGTESTVAFVGPVPQPSGPTAVMLSQDTPVEAVVASIANSGCSERLREQPAIELDDCAELIAGVVVAVQRYEAEKGPLAPETDLLVERLRLAASNVCRARWVASDGLDLNANDPVCRVSTYNLAQSQ